jgi:LysM repeat protein
MKAQRLLQMSAAALLCAGGVSCSLFKKESTDQYATDGGYNPYNNQPGQVASTYQQYQPSQDYGQQQQQQPYQQQQPQYQTYTPPQDTTPEEEYKPTAAPKKKKSTSSDGGGGSYTVKQGDNLYRIALSHNTTVSRLKSANGLTSDLIRPGQHLTLP